MDNMTLNSKGTNSAIKANILSDREMREIGFTDYNPDSWYFCKVIAGPDNITLNVTIPKDGSDIEIITLDEDFLQPYDYQYFLSRDATHQFALNVKREADKWLKYLVDKGVLEDWSPDMYV